MTFYIFRHFVKAHTEGNISRKSMVFGFSCRVFSRIMFADWLPKRDCPTKFGSLPSFLLRHKFSLSHA